MARVRKAFPSSGSWTCPAGIRTVLLTIRPGAGGGAGSSDGAAGTGTISGGGGGTGSPGGGCVSLIQRVPVTPGVAYTLTIGAGGAGGLGVGPTSPGLDGAFSLALGLVRAGRTTLLGGQGGPIRGGAPSGTSAGNTSNTDTLGYNTRAGTVGYPATGRAGASGNGSGSGNGGAATTVAPTQSLRAGATFPSVANVPGGLADGGKGGGGSGGGGGTSVGDEYAMLGTPPPLTRTGGVAASGGNASAAVPGSPGAAGGNGSAGTFGRGGGSGGAGGGGGEGVGSGGAAGAGGNGGAGSDGLILIEYEV